MRLALFSHSLLSDWNHGSAHFLRGIVSELSLRGHEVRAYEPRDAWSYRNLIAERGEAPLAAFAIAYPRVRPLRYDPAALDLDHALAGIDLVLVHEWNSPELIERIGHHHARNRRYALLFHDTHHRAFSRPNEIGAYDLRHYDGVLAFGRVIRELYLRRGWARRAWVWHEAADVRVFRPHPSIARTGEGTGDLVWIGNWGGEERRRELQEFLIEPARALGLAATAYGVRYPEPARRTLAEAGIRYGGWLANFEVPSVLARFRVTVHIPRGPYVRALPGIPTIRPFEALACGIPLVCAPWLDSDGLFSPGQDYLIASDGKQLQRHVRELLADPDRAASLAAHGRRTVLARHTCTHRVDELLRIAAELGVSTGITPLGPPRHDARSMT
jgi:spore maturation protein CgeB